MKKRGIFLLLATLLLGFLHSEPPATASSIAMCRPTIRQIRNIETLFEKDIIAVNNLKLICVYHEDEVTDYAPSRQYVRENDLHWVSFFVITGTVNGTPLYRENRWTPQFAKVFQQTGGMIFTGGMDLPPRCYNEPVSLLSEVTTPVRSFYEVSFLFHLVGGERNPGFTPLLKHRPGYAVMAICLGCQSLNVAAGGSLTQDIPTEIYHLESHESVLELSPDRIHSSRYEKNLHPWVEHLAPAFHPIRIVSEDFRQKMGLKTARLPQVLTSHHQALQGIGQDLEVVARSLDGKIVEAVRHTLYPNVIGVQFHPEVADLYSKSALFRRHAEEKRDFNLRLFLRNHPPSMAFHLSLWGWFSRAIQR